MRGVPVKEAAEAPSEVLAFNMHLLRGSAEDVPPAIASNKVPASDMVGEVSDDVLRVATNSTLYNRQFPHHIPPSVFLLP